MTPAIELLERTGTAHRVVAYEHDPGHSSYGLEAVEALGLDPGRVFKTLLATVDGAETVVAVLPVDRQLDLKALARAAGAKKAVMADPAVAERLTGYVVGGISPLGQRRRLRTFIHDGAEALDEMHVSAGRRGLEVALAPDDLADLATASFHALAAGGHGDAPTTAHRTAGDGAGWHGG